MICREIQRKMSAYLDGELSMPERDAFFEHLHGCSACCDLMGEFSFFEASLAGAMKQRMEAPVAVRYNVMNAISAEQARRAAPTWVPVWQRLAWRPAAAFATVLTLAGAGWRTFTLNFQPVTPPSAQVQDPSHRMAVLTPVPSTKTRTPAVAPVPAPVKSVKPVSTAPPVEPARTTETTTVDRNDAERPAPKPAPLPTAAQTPAERTTAPTAPLAPTMVAANPMDDTVGTVSYVWAPDNVMNGRFLSRRETGNAWEEASYDLDISTHMQTRESTVIEMTLKDGTHLKSNENTEFVVQRAPTKDDASWGIRLVRGELWVRSAPGVEVEIVAPGVSIDGAGAEFSVRTFDGEDTTTMVMDGQVACHNTQGRVDVAAGNAAVIVAGEAPREPFLASDAAGHLEWAYRTKDAYNALDNGVLPR